MKFSYKTPTALLGLALLFSSCYKLENSEPPEARIEVLGMVLDTIIPERNVLWGRIGNDKYEYHYDSKLQNPLNWEKPTSSYYYNSDLEVLSTRYKNGQYELYNLKDGSQKQVLNLTGGIVRFANNKFYTVDHNHLRVYDRNSVLLDSIVVTGIQRMEVSMDGSIIYCHNGGSINSWISVLEWTDTNTLEEIMMYETVGGLNLEPGTYHMSRDGRRIISNAEFSIWTGQLYNEKLEKIQGFGNETWYYKVSADGNKVIQEKYSTVEVSNSADGYNKEEIDLTKYGLNKRKVIPFTWNGQLYIAYSFFDTEIGQEKIILHKAK